MKLSELATNQQVILHIAWGERQIEVKSKVLASDDSGIYITPYLHNGSPLEFNIDISSNVICSLYADNVSSNERVAWKNIEVKTVTRNDGMAYYLKASGFNNYSKVDERRSNKRIVIHKKAQAFDPINANTVDIIVYDISDNGISFFAPPAFDISSKDVIILFSDAIDGKHYQMKIECAISRSEKRAGNVFYGCRVTRENKDYLVYSFLKRLKKSNPEVPGGSGN